MTKKKDSNKHPQQTEEKQTENLEQLEQEQLESMVEADPIDPPNLAEYALMMAAEARVMSLVKVLFPLLEKIEAGEKVTEKDILDKLSSIKIGNKTALEKLTYLRKQQ